MPRTKKQRLKQRADGRYCCKYHGIQFMGNTEDEALKAREEYKRAERDGALVRRDQQTVGEYAQYWLPIHRASVKPSTFNGYASVLEHSLSPIAKKNLAALTSDDVAECYADLAGKSASYIHKAKILITAMLDSATDAGYMLHNPARAPSVKPPKGTAGTHRAITQDERNLILSTPHRFQLAALIMLYAGLRRGEVLALDAADIADDITVRRAVFYVSNQPHLSSPKSAAGVRRVPVLSVLRPFLSDLNGLVLKGSNGSFLTEQAWQRGWESYLRALSMAAGHDIMIKPHDLRHSYCTMLRDAGVDMHQAIIWMGHADEKLILRIYDHPDTERENTSKNLIEATFRMQNGMQNLSE